MFVGIHKHTVLIALPRILLGVTNSFIGVTCQL